MAYLCGQHRHLLLVPESMLSKRAIGAAGEKRAHLQGVLQGGVFLYDTLQCGE